MTTDLLSSELYDLLNTINPQEFKVDIIECRSIEEAIAHSHLGKIIFSEATRTFHIVENPVEYMRLLRHKRFMLHDKNRYWQILPMSSPMPIIAVCCGSLNLRYNAAGYLNLYFQQTFRRENISGSFEYMQFVGERVESSGWRARMLLDDAIKTCDDPNIKFSLIKPPLSYYKKDSGIEEAYILMELNNDMV